MSREQGSREAGCDRPQMPPVADAMTYKFQSWLKEAAH